MTEVNRGTVVICGDLNNELLTEQVERLKELGIKVIDERFDGDCGPSHLYFSPGVYDLSGFTVPTRTTIEGSVGQLYSEPEPSGLLKSLLSKLDKPSDAEVAAEQLNEYCKREQAARRCVMPRPKFIIQNEKDLYRGKLHNRKR